MAKPQNLYGDGQASERICAGILTYFENTRSPVANRAFGMTASQHSSPVFRPPTRLGGLFATAQQMSRALGAWKRRFVPAALP
jgi:hypothetical protein